MAHSMIDLPATDGTLAPPEISCVDPEVSDSVAGSSLEAPDRPHSTAPGESLAAVMSSVPIEDPFSDPQQQSGQGAATASVADKQFAAMWAVVLICSIVLPLTADSSRAVDFLAFLTFTPAVFAFARVLCTPARTVVSPIILWNKFAFGWLVLVPVVCVVSIILSLLALLLLSQVRLDEYAAFEIAVASRVIVVTLIWVGADEAAKLLVALKKDRFTEVGSPRRFVLYSLYTALGLATGEAYYWMLLTRYIYDGGTLLTSDTRQFAQQDDADGALRRYPNSQYPFQVQSPAGGFLTPSDVLGIALCCVVFIIPMHVLSGYHIGLGIAHSEVAESRPRRRVRILLLPFLFRFVFIFTILWVPVLQAGLGLGGPDSAWFRVAALFLIPIYMWIVRRAELRMPRAYLRQAGYMNAFGYGLLPDHESVAEHPPSA